jgi:hypothetical protein
MRPSKFDQEKIVMLILKNSKNFSYFALINVILKRSSLRNYEFEPFLES